METQIIVTIKQDGKKVEEKRWEEEESYPGYHIYSDDDEEITEEEAERQAAVSDLADICEYLEEKDVIAIKLIIQRARKRKERAGE